MSFQLFWDYLNQEKRPFTHLDLPVRHARDSDPPGKVNHLKTIQQLLTNLPAVRKFNSVIIFGSRSFCFTYGLIILLAAKLLGKPGYIRFFGGRPMLEFISKPRLLSLIPLRLLGLSKRIIIETSIGAKEFPDFLQEKIVVVPGYRPQTKISASTNLVKGDQTIKFVYAGEVSEAKGLAILLQAFSDLMALTKGQIDVELHVYGTGSQSLIDRLQASPGVTCHGKVANEELRRRLALYDVFVFTSTYTSEGHPGVLIEALMAELPIISTDLPGPRELIENQVNGLLVPPGDVHQLTQAMARLVYDVALRDRLSQGALKSSHRFDIKYVLPELANVLDIRVGQIAA